MKTFIFYSLEGYTPKAKATTLLRAANYQEKQMVKMQKRHWLTY